MTLFGLALRSHLGGFLVMSAIGAMFGLANTLAYVQIAGSTPADRAIFAQQFEIVGRQLSYMLPIPLELDTMAGYLQWRMFGAFGMIFAFWAVLAGSGAGRGDEDRGLVETWIATGVTRLRYIAVRVAAFLVVATTVVAIMLAGTWVGSVIGNETLVLGPLALQGLDLLILTAFCFAWSLLVAQVATTRRGAGFIAGFVLLVLYLIDGASRTGGFEQVAWLSPFWLYDRSAPLLRARVFDIPAVAALAAATVVDLALAISAFAVRDLGASLLRPRATTGRASARPSRDPFLRMPVLATIDQQRSWIIGWMGFFVVLAAFLISITRTMVDSLLSIPSFRVYIDRLGAIGYDTFVSVIWGSTALLLVSLFAIFQVSTWVADDAEGRLEAALTQPVSRARIALDRVGSLVLASALVIAAGAVAVWIASGAADIQLSADRFVVGTVAMLAVPLAFGAIGAVIAGWRPRAAVPVLTVVAIASYMTQQFAPLFEWPKWVENSSLYALYGQPIAKGVEWGGILVLLAIGLGGTVLGVAAFQRRDVGR
ncbi:MAG TPA: hypothetical protein VGA16_07835 [Candidatus Limnocylindria bacterium]